MNKEMFLKELSDRLLVLNDQERRELLEEYAQHIDLKIASGLSEEEAVKDFGTPEELCAELLDVYHINSEYASGAIAQNKETESIVGKVKNIWKRESVSSVQKSEAESEKEQEENQRREQEKLRKEEEKRQKQEVRLKKLAEKKEQWKEKREERKEKRSVRVAEYEKKLQLKKEQKELQGGSLVKRMIRKTAKLLCGICIFCWKCCLFCVAAPIILMGLFALFMTGTGLVLNQQGYPLTGLSLICGGIFLAAAGLSGMFLSYIFRKRQEEQKNRRRHIQWMTTLLLMGVLLGGVGTGTCLVEFSNLEYGEKVWIGCEKTEKEILTYEITDKDVDKLYCYIGMNAMNTPEIVEDRKIPLDEIRFEVEYNPEYCRPMLETFGAYENGQEKREEIHLWTQRGRKDELEAFFEIKDQLLSELKENKISSYQFASIAGLTIYVHPSNTGKLAGVSGILRNP